MKRFIYSIVIILIAGNLLAQTLVRTKNNTTYNR